MDNEIYNRTELVLGKEKLDKIKKLNICICGVGGVGSYVFESLVRLGVGNITVIDKDNVDVTNINRQLIALNSNIGKSKVEECKKRAEDINPEINITEINSEITVDNVDKLILNSYDYVIDAIDMVDAKVAVIQKCKEEGINIISSMGMANRIDPLRIKVANIDKTSMCPLAKKMRKLLKEKGITKLKVVYSDEQPIKTDSKMLGSVSYVPSAAGLIITSEIVKEILKTN